MREVLVCVIDDDDSVRESLDGLLRSAGHTTRIFASASELLRSDALRHAGCLIIDVCMSVMSGPELQAHLLATRLRVPPLIFMTGRPDEATRQRVMAAGAFAYLHKPFDDETLLSAVNDALAKSSDG